MDKPIAMLPVGEANLERLEARRQKWNHEDFGTTLALLLDVVDFAESEKAAQLAELAQLAHAGLVDEGDKEPAP